MLNRMERVLGIGGFFFRSAQPERLAEWYRTHLGIQSAPASYLERPWHQAGGSTVFAPFERNSDYFPAAQQWMINFRVANLDAMVKQMRAAGVEVKVDPEHYPNGRFARLCDPEGNPIELWEPSH